MAFDPKTPDEVRLLTFDFADKAPTGVTLSAPTATVLAVLVGSGVIGDLTLGTPTVVDQTVTVLASLGLDGSKYRLRCMADGSNGETYEIDKDLQVTASAGVTA